jgi:flagellar hook-basal body complex protein FliE
MRRERIEATINVTKILLEAEVALDLAVQATAQLNAAMTSARISANLSAIVGQGALESANGSLSALVQARSHLVEAHQRLNAVKTDIGLRHLASGDGQLKPGAHGTSPLGIVEKFAA